MNASVVIRGTYHLYQGVAVLPFHLAFGLMQASVYMRLRNLWPLVVSHALLDFVGSFFSYKVAAWKERRGPQEPLRRERKS